MDSLSDVPTSVLDHPVADYSIRDLSDVLTPALAIYADNVAHNIQTTIALLGNDPARWRPHLKTAKLSYVMQMLAAQGVEAVKCATTLELLRACEAGFKDVLLAYPITGSSCGRVLQIADASPEIAVSVLVDSERHVNQWAESRVGVFLDIDPGMKRTGIPQENLEQISQVAQQAVNAGVLFRGLHYYDGHLSDANIQTRTAKAHAGYDHLLKIVLLLESQGIPIGEVITTGTPTFPCALLYSGFARASFIHRLSPGTVVYGDQGSRASLPPAFGYRPAALVLSRVVSATAPGRFTCDAGHKSVSVDAGVPNCEINGWAGLVPLAPTEEHLPVSVGPGALVPELGEILYLVPRHVCPTVNNFSHALLIRNGEIAGVEEVSARGHEGPLWRPGGPSK
jgi:D-serine deaminase-like pyridoxal phosphate-dependent protein